MRTLVCAAFAIDTFLSQFIIYLTRTRSYLFRAFFVVVVVVCWLDRFLVWGSLALSLAVFTCSTNSHTCATRAFAHHKRVCVRGEDRGRGRVGWGGVDTWCGRRSVLFRNLIGSN